MNCALRSFIAQLIEENRDNIRDDLRKVDPATRLMYIEKLLSYTLPKPSPMAFPLDKGLLRLHYGGHAHTVVDEESEECVETRIPTFKERMYEIQ